MKCVRGHCIIASERFCGGEGWLYLFCMLYLSRPLTKLPRGDGAREGGGGLVGNIYAFSFD